jgi:hypothetical protein
VGQHLSNQAIRLIWTGVGCGASCCYFYHWLSANTQYSIRTLGHNGTKTLYSQARGVINADLIAKSGKDIDFHWNLTKSPPGDSYTFVESVECSVDTISALIICRYNQLYHVKYTPRRLTPNTADPQKATMGNSCCLYGLEDGAYTFFSGTLHSTATR